MNIDQICEIIIEVSKQEILPRFRNLRSEEITEKSPGDMVSIADIEVEKTLSRELNRIFPTAIIAGEEAIATNPELLNAAIFAEHAFLIDPIDGTNNFIKGDEKFALMLTELRNGEATTAWIYLPVGDKIVVAEKGSGAFLDGKDVKISPRIFNPSHMTGAAHINRFPEELRTIAKENLKEFKQNRPAFCAGYDYTSLVEGKKDFSVYYRTLPWDHLPGSLIFSEAGGYVRTLFDEKTYTAQDQVKGLLSASDKEQWQEIREIIFPGCFDR